MKKLSFIPVILFLVVASILINSDSANSKTELIATTVDVYLVDSQGKAIEEYIAGCLGYINFNTTTGIATLYNVPTGYHPTCAAGSGYYGTDPYVYISGSYQAQPIFLYQTSGSCPCVED